MAEGCSDDNLRCGLHDMKSDIIERHPLESAFSSAKVRQAEVKRKVLTNTYGAAHLMKMDLDKQILSSLCRVYVSLESDFSAAYHGGSSSDGHTSNVKKYRFQRPPGAIPSSFVGLEAVSGTMENLGFEDYLNDTRDSELVRPVDMHHGMEVRLLVCPKVLPAPASCEQEAFY